MEHVPAPATSAPPTSPRSEGPARRRPRKPPASSSATDPRETPLARRDLDALIARFAERIEHPVERAIAPMAIHALVAFTAIGRKPTRTLTFGWIDPRAMIAATPVDDRHPAGLAACYFAVLASFFRFRADEGALDRDAADRIASLFAQASSSFAKIEATHAG